MKIQDISKRAYSMPISSPSYSRGPYRFLNREFLIISYLTDYDALREVVPEPLQIQEPIVNYEFIKMPDSSGFGNYSESGQVISVIDEDGKKANYTHLMFLNDESPIAGGREIWGFPKKLGTPKLSIESDTLVGTLDYGSIRVAIGTMGYKYQELSNEEQAHLISSTPNYLLKIIPGVDGSAKSCDLVRYFCQDVVVNSAWTGPSSLQLFDHALAPVSQLPVKKIIGSKHLLCDLTLGFGEVTFDYLKS